MSSDIKKALGKTITDIKFDEEYLKLYFEKDCLEIWDDGQICYESRYLHTDDDLPYYIGAVFLGLEQADAPNIQDEWGEHEVSFLKVKTSKGVFTVETHNEHNGYYSGFWVKEMYYEEEG